MKKYRKPMLGILMFLGIMSSFLILDGCGVEETSSEKLRDLEFTVVEDNQVPTELAATMEEKKAEGFKLTYSDQEYLYIAVGYGVQDTSGYSITADKCYLSKNAIYFGSTLVGPSKGEKINKVKSYPCIVIKMEFMEKSVVFE